MKCIRFGVIGLFLFMGGMFIGANVSAATPPKAKAPNTSSTGTTLPNGYQIREAKIGDLGSYKPVFEGNGLNNFNAIQGSVDGKLSKEKSLIKLIAAWLRFTLPIIAFIAVVAIIYAGFTYVTGGGDDGRYDTAKKIVLWVVVGLLVVLGAYAIVNTVITGLVTGSEPVVSG